MSIYLLDTHVALWWLSNNRKLTKKMRELISNPQNQMMVSAVSLWEIIIKKSLNKIEVPDNLKEALVASGFKLLSMTADHALCVENLPYIHNDPFDRLLIAQCIVEDVIFVTADKIIPKYKIKCIV